MKLFWNVICEIYTTLIVSGLKLPPSKSFFNQPTTTNDCYQFLEEIHGDISFTKTERFYILEAAKNFEFFSNNQIKFEITFDLDPTDQIAIDSQSIILRVDQSHDMIVEADGYYKSKILGLCQYKDNDTQTIYLVHDRLRNPITLRTTTIHELGHLVGLDHTQGRSIMHRYNTNSSLYPTYIDAVEFAIRFNCKPSELRYFKL